MSNLVFNTKKEAVEFLRNIEHLEEMSNGNFNHRKTRRRLYL